MTMAGEGRGQRALALAMLLLVYTFNWVDRQILSILAVPIKADLHLSDTQLAALGGLAFAILYSLLGVPLALLADRTRRTWVIAGSLVVWSGFTALCGACGSFATMALCRLGVGVGEAGGVAPSYALIGDIFPAEKKARALSIYSLGIPLGSALGILFGGYIAAMVDWRTAFAVVGLAGVILAPIFLLTVKEPPRPRLAREMVDSGVFGRLARQPAFWLLAFGAGSSSMLGYGLAFWLPSLMRRSFGLDLIHTSRFFGLLFLIGGTAGVMLGGWLGDRMGKGDRGAYARVPAIAFALAVPLFAAGILSGSVIAAFLLFLIPQALAYVWLGPVLTAVQHLVPPPMRATASASFLLINNLIGVGFGALTIGALSDHLTSMLGEGALKAAVLASLGFYLIAAALMALAAKPLRRAWVEA